MKKRNIDYLSVESLENMILSNEKSIQKEKESIKKHVDSIYESLVEFHVPISEDTFLFESDNVLDMFRDDDKDIIYINGKVFLLKQEYSKLPNPNNPDIIKRIDKEKYQDFKRLVFSVERGWIEWSLKSIERSRNAIKKLYKEIELKKNES